MSILAGLIAAGIGGHSAAVEPSPPARDGGGPAALDGRGDGPFSIFVRSGRFKSIATPLEWTDIPRLAVLTGVNGSGKSQLLKALAIHYGDNTLRQQHSDTDIIFTVEGQEYQPHDVLFLEDMAKPLQRAMASAQMFEDQLQAYRRGQSDHPYEQKIAHHVMVAGTGADTLSLAQLLYYNPRMT